MMKIKHSDGYFTPLAERIKYRLEGDWVLAHLLDLLVEKSGITEAELRNCAVIDNGESLLEDLGSTTDRPTELSHPWPPPGYGNTDALADIYNIEYKKALQQVSSTDAHQHACEVIHKLGWHDGKHIGAREKPFVADGLLPQGYLVFQQLHYNPEEDLHDSRARAEMMDGSWVGPWRSSGQQGLLVADAWKHVTKAIDADVDEAGGG